MLRGIQAHDKVVTTEGATNSTRYPERCFSGSQHNVTKLCGFLIFPLFESKKLLPGNRMDDGLIYMWQGLPFSHVGLLKIKSMAQGPC